MTADQLPPPHRFLRKAFVDQPAVVGARWWQESLQASAQQGLSRRQALVTLGATLGPLALGGFLAAVLKRPEEIEISMDALELQRREGWDVGHVHDLLRIDRPAPGDVDGGQSWLQGMLTLAQDLAPAQASLAPFYVRTLLQSPAEAGNATLRAVLMPVAPAADDADAVRGAAIRTLFETAKMPRDVAVILDLDGAQSVAVAAGMAPAFEPVFVLDNWPHPLGVVHSQQTLGAALYYQPLFLRLRSQRPAGAPPVFVLDRNRLARYTDEDTQFDNRYVARLPTSGNFAALGIKHILYVTPTRHDKLELDDLNEEFVDYQQASIDVRTMALTDLEHPEGAPRTVYYYGGHSQTHLWFWHVYGWHTSRVPAPVTPAPSPARVSNGAAYRPALRPTIFSSRVVGGSQGIGRQKPSGFGRVSVRTSKSTGAFTGMRTGRSGSFGRAGGWGGS